MEEIPVEDELAQPSEWIEKNVDSIRRDILQYNPILLQNLKDTNVDGFYFYDDEHYSFLFDNKNGKVRIMHNPRDSDFVLDDKINVLNLEGHKIFFDNKVIIKDNKKFFHILSKRKSLFIRLLSIFPIIKKKLVSVEPSIDL